MKNPFASLIRGIYSAIMVDHGILYPRWLWLEATDRCNSRCEYCNIHQKTPIKDPLSPYEIKKILSSPLFKDVKLVINSGGEATVRNDLLEILLAEHEALPAAALQISTNGLLPDRLISIAEEICKRGIVLDIGISLDGVGEEHDRIRGVKGNFEKVDYLVSALKNINGRVSLGATLMEKNLEANLRAKKYADDRNIHFIFHWFNNSSFYDNEKGAHQQRSSKIAKAINLIRPGIYRDMWLRYLDGIYPKFRCFALNTFAVLKCNGDIVPCLSMWDSSIGNARYHDPLLIWRSAEAAKVRRSVKECKGCLNSWGVGWSLASIYYRELYDKIKIFVKKSLGYYRNAC